VRFSLWSRQHFLQGLHIRQLFEPASDFFCPATAQTAVDHLPIAGADGEQTTIPGNEG
jgi:hypothetical protein